MRQPITLKTVDRKRRAAFKRFAALGRVRQLAFVAVFVAIGTALLLAAHAANTTGFPASPQNGTLTPPASLVQDSGAIGQRAVQFGTSSGSSGGSGSGASGFIYASGTKLMLNGSQYQSISFDFIPLGACNWSGNNWSQSDMTTFFKNIPAGSMARAIIPPGDVSASFVQQLVQTADTYGDHLIIALAHGIVSNNCDTEDKQSNNGKTAAYYTTNATKSGSPYYNWVNSVVTPLANDPGVAIWEIINEPISDAGGGAELSDVGGVSGFVKYVNAADTIIKNAEMANADVKAYGKPKQLISIAPDDMPAFGGTSGMQSIFSNLDILDLHDYSGDLNGNAVYSDFSSYASLAKNMNKPFMVDEAGVEAGPGCNGQSPENNWDSSNNGPSLQGRVTFMTQKAQNYFGNGLSAMDIWAYQTGEDNSCIYENIDTNDPIMSFAKTFQIP